MRDARGRPHPWDSHETMEDAPAALLQRTNGFDYGHEMGSIGAPVVTQIIKERTWRRAQKDETLGFLSSEQAAEPRV